MLGRESEAQRSRRVHNVIRGCIRRRVAGEALSDEEIASDHPDLLPELGRELQALALIQRAEQRASDTVNHVNDRSSDVSLPSDSFPGYMITGEIHRGGQGVVYEALQKSTQRKVAIKAMKEGPFGRSSDRTRFEREVQILGQLRHPHIVTIYDSGSAAGGFYFVMDYIAGSALDEFMAGQERSIPEILELFARVCDAVNAAHLHGIIHRDLKPSNIRVDPQEEPHILDFGLAKVATGEDERSGMTLTGQFVGSVPWASPEQAEGMPQRIDMRTDVYSLGMILYHMLTSRFPYEVTGNVRDVIDNILKAEPVRPSAVRKQIDDEVETIVLKCLSKEPQRRYQTAGELARDIRRYLAGEPIEAKRDSVGYVFRKHLRQYRLPLAVAAAFVLVVTAGFLTSLAFWHNAADERDAAEEARAEAERQAEITQTVNDFLNNDLLASVDPRNTTNREITVKEVLDSASAEIEGVFDEQPLVEAAIRMTLGTTYHGLGKYDSAEQHVKRALEIRRDLLGEAHPDTLVAANRLGLLYAHQARNEEAESLYLRTLELRRQVLGEDHRDTLTSVNNLALWYQDQGQEDVAEPLFEELLERRRRLLGEEDPGTLITMGNLARSYQRQGRYDEAAALFQETLELRRRVLGEMHPVTLSCQISVASLHQLQGQYADAEALYLSAIESMQDVLGSDHPRTLTAMNNLGLLYRSQGRLDEAERLLVAVVGARRRVLGEEHPKTLVSLGVLARLYMVRGRYAEAEPLCLQALESHRRSLGDEHPHTLTLINNLAGLYQTQGRLDEADALYGSLLEVRARVLGEEHPHTLTTMSDLAMLRQKQERYKEAESLFLRTVEAQRRVHGDEHPHTLRVVYNLARLLHDRGRHDEAAPLYQQALDGFRRAAGAEHPDVLAAQTSLVQCLVSLRDYETAEPLARELRALCESNPQVPPTTLVMSLYLLADILLHNGKPAEAEPLLRNCLEIRRAAETPDDRLIADTESLLGGCLTALGRYEEAESLLLDSCARIESSEGENSDVAHAIRKRIVDLYETWPRPDKATAWRASHPAAAETVKPSEP